MADGDCLPPELSSIVGLKLNCTGDRIRFRAVSKSWRSAIPFRRPPWLMLSHSPKEEEDEGTTRGFVIVGDQTITKAHFPEMHRARVVGSAGNWLITVHLDKTIRVTHAFSRLQFHLPSHFDDVMFVPSRDEPVGVASGDEITPKWYRNDLIIKIVPSWSQPDCTDVCCVAVVSHFYDQALAIARPGDASWTLARLVDSPRDEDQWVEDVLFYKGHVYAVNALGHLIFCDVGDGVQPPEAWFFSEYTNMGYPHRVPGDPKHYLVELLGELLKVVRYVKSTHDDDDDDESYKTHTFKIYKVVDFANTNLVELNSLGDHSLFLGLNTSVSVLASDYFGLVRRNCIYFTDDRKDVRPNRKFTGFESGHDMGVFDLENNSITPHFEGISTSLYSPPVWIIPSQTM